MRLLHLADRLTDRGGAYRHLLGVLERLAPEHELLLAVGRDEGHAGAPCPVTLVPGLDARTAVPVGLEEVAAAFRPDVIHVHNLMNPEALHWAAATRRAVITVQDHRYFCPTRGKWTTQGAVCRDTLREDVCAACFDDASYFREIHALTVRRLAALRRMPRVVVLSRYMKQELAAAAVLADRIYVIPPFVHGLDLSAEPDGPPCVLFVGRLVEAKGVHDALEAWRRSGVDLPLVFAGTGPLRASLKAEGVEVLGWVSHERLSALYRRARAVVLPSRWQEPFGIAGLEAASFGVPVVAWDSGGIREWHPGDGLVPWGDVTGLATALRTAVARRSRPPLRAEPAELMNRLTALYRSSAV